MAPELLLNTETDIRQTIMVRAVTSRLAASFIHCHERVHKF